MLVRRPALRSSLHAALAVLGVAALASGCSSRLEATTLSADVSNAFASPTGGPSASRHRDGGADGSGGGAVGAVDAGNAGNAGTASGADGGTASAPAVVIGATFTGDGTYYDANTTGHCSYDFPSTELNIVALNTPQYAGSAACGTCVRITGPRGTITARVIDECAGCKSGDIDVSQLAFPGIADLSAGRVPISWTPVACDVAGPVAYRFKSGSSQWWAALQVRNHRVPVATLEVQTSAGWTSLPREPDNYFFAGNLGTTGPIHVRVTADDGQVLEDTIPSIVNDADLPGAAQFR